MADILVRQVFRHANGKLAANTLVEVTLRNDDDVILDETTDAFGTVVVYLPPGSYDWLVLGDRTPFDVLAPGVSAPTPPHIHSQPTPAATWTITHNRNSKPPVVVVLDGAEDEPVFTGVTYPDLNTAVVEMPEALAGTAYIP